MKTFALFIFLLLSNTLLPDGFVAGTLVKVPDGYRPIEELHESDFIYYYNVEDASYSFECLTTSQKESGPHIIAQITCGPETIFTTPDQHFLTINNNWVSADVLQPGTILKCLFNYITVDSVEFFEADCDIYMISLHEKRTFFITEHNIIVHNLVPFTVGVGYVGAGIMMSPAAPLVLAAGITVGIVGGGLWAYHKFKGRRHPQHQLYQTPRPSNQQGKTRYFINNREISPEEYDPNNPFVFAYENGRQLTPGEVLARFKEQQKQKRSRIPPHLNPMNISFFKDNESQPPSGPGEPGNGNNGDGPPPPPPPGRPQNRKRWQPRRPKPEDALGVGRLYDEGKKRNSSIHHTLPGKGKGWTKLKGNQGWRDQKGNYWKKDMKHREHAPHWDVSNRKGSKIREVDFEGKELWPNGPKNKCKKP